MVAGYPVDPGGQLAPGFEGAELGDHLEEYLLGRVLRLAEIAEHAQAEVEDGILDAARDFLQRLPFPPGQSLNAMAPTSMAG
jgi:hypothetical protein